VRKAAILMVSDIFSKRLKETAMATITKTRRTDKPITIKSAPTTAVEQEIQSGDEIWEELWSASESDALILQLEAELEEDILNGRVEKGGFGDAD
jgi:hypothetical protein